MAESPSRFAVLWSFTRPHLRTLLLALFLGLLASGSELATPMVTKWVLDSVAVGGSLTAPILILIALLIVGVSIGLVQWILLGTMAEDIVYDARKHLVGRYLRAKVLPLLKRPTGELVTRVTSDSVLLREAASQSLVGLVNGAVMLVGTLVLMAVLDFVLLGTTVVAIVIVAVLFMVLMPGLARMQERAQASLGDVGSGLEGTLRAIKTVKAASVEDHQLERLLKDARKARNHGVDAVKREAIAWTLAWSGIQTAIIVILAVGGVRIASGAMEASTLVAFLLYAFGLMGPIMGLSQNVTALQSGMAAAGRIREIDALETEAQREEHVEVTGGGLALRGVSARYADDAPWALQDVSIEVPDRGHVALVGPSGAGKTSVMSTILGFLEPQSGEVIAGNRSYAELSPRQVRRRLAYVEQETPVVPGTIRENLLLANRDASEAEIWDVLRELHLDQLITQLPDGVDTPLSDTSVSGGQRQRIALARALLARPEILLLDEATAQVDGITEEAISQAILRQAQRGAVLTIAHRLSTVVDADQIIVMEGGGIVARGAHRELLETSPLYAELVAALSLETTSPG